MWPLLGATIPSVVLIVHLKAVWNVFSPSKSAAGIADHRGATPGRAEHQPVVAPSRRVARLAVLRLAIAFANRHNRRIASSTQAAATLCRSDRPHIARSIL